MAQAGNRLSLGVPLETRDGLLTKGSQMWNCHPVKESDFTVAERRFGYQTSSLGVADGNGLGIYQFGANVVAITAQGANATLRIGGAVISTTLDSSSRYWFSSVGFNSSVLLMKNTNAAYTWDGGVLTKITDSNYPSVTTSGVAFLDGTVYVQDIQGRVWNSNLNTPATWNALAYVQGSLNSDTGVAIARYAQFVMSLCTLSCTLFYDAGSTPPASPLAPQTSVVVNIGCASGDSVVEANNTVMFMGQTRQKGRSIYVMSGMQPTVISTPYVDRVLNKSTLVGLRAFCVSIYGHNFYILNLYDLNVTLVYDFTTEVWGRWTSSIIQPNFTITAATLIGNVATFTVPNHAISNGTLVHVSGTGLLFDIPISVVDSNTLTFEFDLQTVGDGGIDGGAIDTWSVNGQPVVLSTVNVTSIVLAPYVQNAFTPAFYATTGGNDYLQDNATGALYSMSQTASNDAGRPVYQRIDTEGFDGGSNVNKFFSTIDIIADKIRDYAYIMYSDDDYTTYSRSKQLNLGANRVQRRRHGRARRRSFTLMYAGNYPARFYSLELGIDSGVQ